MQVKRGRGRRVAQADLSGVFEGLKLEPGQPSSQPSLGAARKCIYLEGNEEMVNAARLDVLDELLGCGAGDAMADNEIRGNSNDVENNVDFGESAAPIPRRRTRK